MVVGTVALAAIGTGTLTVLHGAGEGVPLERPLILNTLGTFKPGQDTFSMALMPLEEKGQDIEIVKVEARTSSNVEHIGTAAVWPRDLDVEGNPGNMFGFPVLGPSHPALGIVVPAAELDYSPKGFDGVSGDLFVNAGFRLVSGDVGAVNGIRVTYRVGNKIKQKFFAHAVIVCKAPNRCGNPGGATNYSQGVLATFGMVPEGTY